MADGVFNIAKGRVVQLAQDDATKFGVLLLKAAEADGTLEDYDDLSALLGAAGNTEADFTNYARKTGLTATGTTVDDTNDRYDLDLSDQTWTSAGGTTDNTLAKAIVFYEVSASDAGRVPVGHYDFTPTTNGNDLTLEFDANGFYRAA